jgi:hypothetical protein
MAWIKRNLYFVITVVVGLGVTGFCGYLLLSALDQNKTDSDKYFSDKGSLENLQKKVPFPDRQNIQAAEADAERVRTFLEEFRKPFAGFPAPHQLGDEQFKAYLQKAILKFATEATNAGVGLPPGFYFSFSRQIDVFNYASDSIPPWMQEISEINAILRILFDAKINYLEKIKRPAVTGEDAATDEYMQAGPVTNTSSVVTPYMVNFKGFSGEIAKVLAGIAASSNCLIVKAIHVSPSRELLPQITDLQPAAPPPPMYRYQPPPQAETPMNPFLQNNLTGPRAGSRMERRQLYAPPQYAQAFQAPAVPAAPTGPVTFLRETPLYVTLYVDVVKLKALEKPAPAPAAPGGSRRRAER